MSNRFPLALRRSLSSCRRLSFESLEDRRLLSTAPSQVPDASWIQLGLVAYQSAKNMVAPTATVYGTTGNAAGYQNGDIVTLPAYTTLSSISATGYSITPASFQLTVVNGNVAAVTCVNSGDYTWGDLKPSYPANPVAVTGGSGSGLELSVNWTNGATTQTVSPASTLDGSGMWVAQNADWLDGPQPGLVPLYAAQTGAQQLLYMNYYAEYVGEGPNLAMNQWCAVNPGTATINGQGNGGYTDGEIVTLAGGTGTPAQFQLTVSGGVVTAATLFQPGNYTAMPGPSSVPVTGPTGSGLTLDLTAINLETMYLHYDTPTTVTYNDGNGPVALPGVGGLYQAVASGANGSWSGNVMTDASQNWTANQWAGFTLTDASNNNYTIVSNTADTITVNSQAAPASGAYSIAMAAPLGSRVPTYGWYGKVGLPYTYNSLVVMNVGNPNYQAWASQYYLSQMQSVGYTGIFIDNSYSPGIGSLGTPTPSGNQVFYEYPSASGLTAAETDYGADYVACVAASRAAFGSAYSIYPNFAGSNNWTALLPYVNGVFREFMITLGSSKGLNNSEFVSNLAGVAQAQAYGVSNIISCIGLADSSPPTAAVCYPGYFYDDNAITALSNYYLTANPSDYFCDQENLNNVDPQTRFDFGALTTTSAVQLPRGIPPLWPRRGLLAVMSLPAASIPLHQPIRRAPGHGPSLASNGY